MTQQRFTPEDVEIARGFGFAIQPEDVFRKTPVVPLAPRWLSDEQLGYFWSEQPFSEKILKLRDLMVMTRNGGCGLVDSSYVEALYGIVHHSAPQPSEYIKETLEKELLEWSYGEKPRPSRIVPFERFGEIMLRKRFRQEVFNL